MSTVNALLDALSQPHYESVLLVGPLPSDSEAFCRSYLAIEQHVRKIFSQDALLSVRTVDARRRGTQEVVHYVQLFFADSPFGRAAHNCLQATGKLECSEGLIFPLQSTVISNQKPPDKEHRPESTNEDGSLQRQELVPPASQSRSPQGNTNVSNTASNLNNNANGLNNSDACLVEQREEASCSSRSQLEHKSQVDDHVGSSQHRQHTASQHSVSQHTVSQQQHTASQHTVGQRQLQRQQSRTESASTDSTAGQGKKRVPPARKRPRRMLNGRDLGSYTTDSMIKCHHCREFKNVQSLGQCVSCDRRYCETCLLDSYASEYQPDCIGDKPAEPFLCPKCQNKCKCETCRGKRQRMQSIPLAGEATTQRPQSDLLDLPGSSRRCDLSVRSLTVGDDGSVSQAGAAVSHHALEKLDGVSDLSSAIVHTHLHTIRRQIGQRESLRQSLAVKNAAIVRMQGQQSIKMSKQPPASALLLSTNKQGRLTLRLHTPMMSSVPLSDDAKTVQQSANQPSTSTTNESDKSVITPVLHLPRAAPATVTMRGATGRDVGGVTPVALSLSHDSLEQEFLLLLEQDNAPASPPNAGPTARLTTGLSIGPSAPTHDVHESNEPNAESEESKESEELEEDESEGMRRYLDSLQLELNEAQKRDVAAGLAILREAASVNSSGGDALRGLRLIVTRDAAIAVGRGAAVDLLSPPLVPHNTPVNGQRDDLRSETRANREAT